jgi:hypothetical protein
MRTLVATLAVLVGCAGPRGMSAAEDSYIAALRDEARAVRRIERIVDWEKGTGGGRGELAAALAGHDGLAARTALESLARAEARPELDEPERRALRFLRRSLASRAVLQATAPLDEQLEAANGSDEALHALREAAAQKAARQAGYRDYAALSEDVREVDLKSLLAQGEGYLRSTDALYRRTLDRVSREDLGVPAASLSSADLPRLFAAPRLLLHFPRERELSALELFLDGIGLDLKTAAGAKVVIDAEARPAKRQRAFAAALDAGADVRLSIQPRGGLHGYGSLFHEAGHAVHFAAAPSGPSELSELGYLAPSEAFGELFRHALADPIWLRKFDSTLGPKEIAAVLRRAALMEMQNVRRQAYAKIAFELKLHEGKASAAELRESYARLQSEALGVPVDGGRYFADVDDTFYAADYARGFALAAALEDALRDRFGEGWTARRDVGPWLRRELFAAGRALSADEVAARLGTTVDFARLARRAERLVQTADALEGTP